MAPPNKFSQLARENQEPLDKGLRISSSVPLILRMIASRIEVEGARGVMSSVAKVALVCVIVLCGWLLHWYVPRDLYLHCWTDDLK
jgi:hypothetical protein